MRHSGLALLSVAAIGLTVAAGPAFAQTFNGYDNKDPAVTQSYAPFEGNNGYYGGYNNGPPLIGPVVGMMAAPFGGFVQPVPGCFVDRDFNGRYTAMCGM
jgi:hypothetical protein